jgi:hypothetical protein
MVCSARLVPGRSVVNGRAEPHAPRPLRGQSGGYRAVVIRARGVHFTDRHRWGGLLS